MHPYSRRLDDSDLIEHFLVKVLEFNPENIEKVITEIKNGEFQIKSYPEEDCTLWSTKHRRRKFSDSSIRWRLRKQIVQELFTEKRLEKDDEIVLGKGGALPSNEPKSEKLAVVLTGLPASGKSGIANELADKLGAIILDSDFAKRKLPEFEDGPGSASLVHAESDLLIFGSDEVKIPEDFKPLFQLALTENYNLVIPKIGHKLSGVLQLGEILKAFGYETHLVCINLDRRKATIRAINRFMDTGRYVPLGLIFDAYANDPLGTYFLIKDSIDIVNSPYDSFGLISTDVAVGEAPRVLQTSPKSPL
tara:strand:- start:2530 stop:3447 length:918 start_codon:yes stop_codon:yes gene_type:complete